VVSRRGLHNGQLVGQALSKVRTAALASMHPNKYDQKQYCLERFIDKIKTDRSFVNELASRDGSMAIARAVAGLGKSLGISTKAEGVETDEQLALLRSKGCTEVQGYLFSPPRPTEDVESMLSTGRSRILA
jgi:EAL domain-containing protein (putative c-di-GMP-specific phosphodiesterase class I)